MWTQWLLQVEGGDWLQPCGAVGASPSVLKAPKVVPPSSCPQCKMQEPIRDQLVSKMCQQQVLFCTPAGDHFLGCRARGRG